MTRYQVWATTVILLVSAAIAVADFPAPYHTRRAEVDQLVAEFSRTRDQRVFQRIAGEFIDDPEQPVSVREYAAARLAEVGAAETEPYFIELAATSEEPVLRGAARLGVWKVRFLSAVETGQRRGVAVAGLRGEGTGPHGRDVQYWAAQELCEIGAVEDLEEIHRAFRNSYGEKRAKEDGELCQRQIAIARSENRVEALAAGLAAPDPLQFRRYHLWIIGELESLGEEGEAALIEHATRLSKDQAVDTSGELGATIRALRRIGLEPDELVAAGLPSSVVHRSDG